MHLPRARLYDGAMNGKVFLAYGKQALIPTLTDGDIVVMDNLAPKATGVRDVIERAGASLTLPAALQSRLQSR